MRRPRSRLALTLVAALLGFLVVVQLRFQAAGPGLGNLSAQELTELIANVTTRNDQLRSEISTLERQATSIQTTLDRGDTSLGQVRSDLARVRAWAGLEAVRGSGVRVSITGVLPGSAYSALVNELWNAGAEAVAIGDVRIVPGIVPVGETGSASLGGRTIPADVDVTAIGQPETITGSLARAGGPIAQLGARFPDVAITVDARDDVTLPATTHRLIPTLAHPRL